MQCVLGVDGGNTKTIAFVVGLDGRILGVGRSGNSDIYAHDTPDSAVDTITAAVDQALSQAAVDRDALVSACYSLAGADWPEDYADYRDRLAARGLGQTITVYNDAIGALRAGSPDGTGVVIACGTGGAMGARNANGDFWHTSYWQDSMCGREIGYQAIRVVRHADIGIEPPTALTRQVTQFFGVETVTDLLRRFWLRPLQPPSDVEVSRLAPLVLTEAERGDPAARHLIIDHGVRLAEYALAAARKVHIETSPLTVVLNGGIFRHPGTLLKDAIVGRLREQVAEVAVFVSRYEPVMGAVMLAYDAIHVPITDALRAAFDATMPASEVFRTAPPHHP